MDKIKLIYICTDNVGAVVEGQVYKLLEYFQTKEIFSEIVLLQPYKSADNLNTSKQLLERYTFRKVYFYMKPLTPHKYFINLKNLKTVLYQEVTDNSVIHCRASFTSGYIRKALPRKYENIYVLTEFRGLVQDELIMKSARNFFSRLLVRFYINPFYFLLLRRVYRDDNAHLTAVSPYFAKLIEKDNFPKEKISVHPNIVSPDFVFNEKYRAEIRKKYAIPIDKPVAVLSSGGGSVWQGDGITINRLLNLGFTVFNLGKHEVHVDGVVNGFIPRKEMPKYLSAADVAVLWRDDVPLNNVACPSKFGEFVTMGLYVIHNGTVDIARKFIEKNDAGVIVKSPNEITIDKKKLSINERKNRCKVGYETFSVERVAMSYIRHYTQKN